MPGGRPRKKADELKSAPISFRITEALRENLERKRHEVAPPRTLSQEIERRLVLSLDDAVSVDPADFGTPQTRGILLAVATAISDVEQLTGQHWYQNRFTFDEVVKATQAVFDNFKPAGRRTPPASFPVLLPGFPDVLRKEIRDDWIKQGVGKVCANNVCKILDLWPRESPEKRADMARTFPQLVTAARLLLKHLTKAPIKFGFKLANPSKFTRGPNK